MKLLGEWKEVGVPYYSSSRKLAIWQNRRSSSTAVVDIAHISSWIETKLEAVAGRIRFDSNEEVEAPS